ncbi:transporter substrate-binding protein [Bacillus sp. T33-2]|uniref:transporter substrate-binding protein n=1 Tax=Bacillus sp. T33-2 TaxID=2054168 RepID=UPI000C77E261|nr:transporter substrate-binding protein [Bacillus sp. T33-2]PLR95767.1 sigma-54-dependent Fis family transcriptional regulator [Bacillus sp. T33-2]
MKIGLLFSLTGTTAITERGQCAMAQYAVHEFNKKHHRVEVIVRDIASNPVKSAKEADMLARQGVKVFVGCYTSACRKAILPILERYECMLVYPTLYEGMECHANVFYTGEVPNQQVLVLIDYLTKQYGKKVYCIGTDYIYPRETNVQVRKYLSEKGGDVVGEQYVPFGHQQFFTILQEVVSKQPDAIFLTLVGSSVIPFYKTYYEMGLNPETLPIFSPITKETEIAAMKPEYAAGHYGAASYFQSLDNDENQKFLRDFKLYTRSEKVVSSVMYNTYLGTILTLEAIFKGKTTEFRSIFYELSSKRIETPCGSVQVEADFRHLARPSRIGRVKTDGQFSIVWDSRENIRAKPFLEKGKQTSSLLNPHILDVWMKISEEAVIITSSENEIIYSSEKAKKYLRSASSDSDLSSNISDLDKSFKLIRYDANDQKVILLKPKPNISISQSPLAFHMIKTINENYKKQLQIGHVAAESKANVLIMGETGTGKEMMARAIHMESDRKNQPFIAVNTASIPKDLIASELFGFADGAFTGAKRGGQAGKFEAAHRGTLFLDEIGEMTQDLQVVLLRAIESGTIMRLGENIERKVDVRIIAATNRNLKEEIANNGSFRSDLYYRLNVLSITIPPLRERKEDIPHLANEIVRHICNSYGRQVKSLRPASFEPLLNYPWSGNIRELRNVLEHAVLMAGNQEIIEPQHLPQEIHSVGEQQQKEQYSIKTNERNLIEQALKTTDSITEASKTLGISRSTLYRKLREYKLT